MTEVNGKGEAALGREYVDPNPDDQLGYRIASLSPHQVEIVKATEELLSLAAGRRLVVVVYDPPAAAEENPNEDREKQTTASLTHV